MIRRSLMRWIIAGLVSLSVVSAAVGQEGNSEGDKRGEGLPLW